MSYEKIYLNFSMNTMNNIWIETWALTLWKFIETLTLTPWKKKLREFLTVKFDKCSRNKHDAISRKVSNAQKKVRGMLNAEVMKWLLRFSIIKLMDF